MAYAYPVPRYVCTYVQTWMLHMYVLRTGPSTRKRPRPPAAPEITRPLSNAGDPIPRCSLLPSMHLYRVPISHPRHPAYPRHAHSAINQRPSPPPIYCARNPRLATLPPTTHRTPLRPAIGPAFRAAARIALAALDVVIRRGHRPAQRLAAFIAAFTTARGATLLRSLPLRALARTS